VLPAGFIEPCLSTIGLSLGVKHGGYLMIVRRDGDRVRLFTRRAFDWTHRFGWILHSLQRLAGQLGHAGWRDGRL
jgi:ATP-dependent DNA ligase